MLPEELGDFLPIGVFVIIMGSPDLGRSNQIGVIRKTRNVFKNLRFLEKGNIALDN